MLYKSQDKGEKLEIKFLVTCPMPRRPETTGIPYSELSPDAKLEYDQEFTNRDVRPG